MAAATTEVVALVVTGGPGGKADERRGAIRVEDELLAPADAGPAEMPGEAPATFTTTWDDAGAMARGELDPSVAFMQGRAKVAGDMGPALRLLRLSGTGNGAPLRDQLAALISSA